MGPLIVAWSVAWGAPTMETSAPARLGWSKALAQRVQTPNMDGLLGWVLPSGAGIALGAMTLTGPVGGVGYVSADLTASISAGQFAQASFIVVSDALSTGVTFSLRNSTTAATTVLVTTAGLLGTFNFSGLVGGTGDYDQLTIRLTSNTLLNIAVIAQASILA